MARTPVRTCIDRMLPIELLLDSMGRSLRENPHNAAALNMHTPLPGVLPIHPQPALAALTGKLWQPGRTLRIAFLDGDPALHERIFEYAAVWTRHANLHSTLPETPTPKSSHSPSPAHGPTSSTHSLYRSISLR